MDIREYMDDDSDEVIALWAECGLSVPHNNPGRDIERKLSVDRDLFLVGESGDEIVATVMGGYEGHRGWINYLAVKPSFRRRGYGQVMMEAVEGRIEAKGCPKINLQIRSSNAQVIAFYRSIGYVEDHVVSLGKRLEHDN